MTLVVAGIAALAILLIAVGVASSGSSGISDRLERYASGKQEAAPAQNGQGPIGDLIAQRQAIANLTQVVEQRDFGANLARDIARADLKLKPTEFILIWVAATVGIPLFMILLSPFVTAFGSPITWLVGALVGFFL